MSLVPGAAERLQSIDSWADNDDDDDDRQNGTKMSEKAIADACVWLTNCDMIKMRATNGTECCRCFPAAVALLCVSVSTHQSLIRLHFGTLRIARIVFEKQTEFANIQHLTTIIVYLMAAAAESTHTRFFC